MPILRFPDPSEGDADGILAVGGDLHPQSLLLAYGKGIFPWPIDGLGLAWFCPDPRAILDFSLLHIPRSLQKAIRKNPYQCTIDQDFQGVIRACAEQPRQGQNGTWITPEMIEAYIELHRLGYAHSAEVWEGRRLIGGIYGVAVQGAFSAESMFHRKSNGSKIALLHLASYLQGRRLNWLDIQMMTPHMERLGAIQISREDYLQRLQNTQAQNLTLF